VDRPNPGEEVSLSEPPAGFDRTGAPAVEVRARQESALMAALIDALDVGVLVEDEQRRILVANPAFVDMFGLGLPPGALTGTRLADLPSPARWAALDRPGVHELRLADDRIIEARHTPVEPAGLWVFRDVTTAAAARAELSALKSEFFAVVSHEVRTPLTSIASLAEQLSGEGLSDRDTAAAIAAVMRNTERMLSLVEDLNVLANLESDGLRGPRSEVDVADLVHDAARFVDALSPQLTVAVSVPEGPPVEGDPKLLAQLIHAVIGAVATVATTDSVTVAGSVDEDGWTIAASAYAADLGTAERLLAAGLPEPDTGPYRRSVALSVLLARAIATSHGGTLTREQEPDGRAFVTVRLPVL
jgi:signal transduction histidine kinase